MSEELQMIQRTYKRHYMAAGTLFFATAARAFAHENVVVVAQRGVWRSVETGEVIGERDLASRFRLADQRVVQFARYDTLDVALEEAGLHSSDEIAVAS